MTDTKTITQRIDALTDGDFIQLTKDVVVENPDRREKYNWKLEPIVKAGTKLSVRVEEHPFDITDEKTIVRKSIDVRPIRGRGSAARLWRERLDQCEGPLVVQILEASEPAELTAAEVAEASGWATVSIVEALERAGIVTAADMRRAIKEEEERDEEGGA